MDDLFPAAPEPPTELGRYRVLSSTAGIRVSPLLLGAMSIGEAWSEHMGSMSKQQSFDLLDEFVRAGGNFIDTASNYQNEQSEKWIGEWMAERGNRDKMVIATKFTMPYVNHAQGPGLSVNYCGNHKRSLHMSLRDSLEKLQTTWVDILYLHWWDYTTSIEEVMDSLDVVVKQGKVLYLGISDSPAWVVTAANYYARSVGKTPFSIYQGRWNVMLRDLEREILPMARHFGMAVAAWDVMGGGKFQTKKALEDRQGKGESLRSLKGKGQTEDEVKYSEALAKVAEEHGITSVTAIALAYVRSKAPKVFPLVGGRKVEHLKDNIQALSIKLTDQQVKYLESIRDFDAGFPYNFIGQDPNVTGFERGGLPPPEGVKILHTVGQQSFLESAKFSDLTIRIDNYEFKVHKIVVCGQSEYFDRLFSRPWKETADNVIQLEEDDPRAVEAMIHFMYGREYDSSGNNQGRISPMLFNVEVYRVADKYGVATLKKVSRTKFDDAAKICWDMDDFPHLITDVYSNSPCQELRETIARVSRDHMEALLKKDNFLRVLNEASSFAADLVQLMAEGCNALK